MKKIIGFIIFILMFVLLLLAINVSAEGTTTTIGYLTFKEHDTYCEVTACSTSATGSIDIPSSVVFDGNSIPVTSIGSEAFSSCSKITMVKIPNSITAIGSSAFSGCSGLTRVYITNINNWCSINFENISSNPLIFARKLYLNYQLISDLVIPNGITSIGNYTFCYCESITSLTIPDTIMSIGKNAFERCTGLTSVTIPDSVKSIGYGAFSYCSGLNNIIIGNSVISIGDYAFNYCSGLTSLVIPNSVTSIGSNAFNYCHHINSVTIPDSVTSIGDYAFYKCGSLESITIPDSVTELGICAFGQCPGVRSVTIGGGVTSLGASVFSNCNLLESVTIEDGITLISEGMFASCPRLKSITIPDSVISIGATAFSNCTGLINILLPDGVMSIGKGAFYYCTSLTNITITNSITSIGTSAFKDCSSINKFYYLGTGSDWSNVSVGDQNNYLLSHLVYHTNHNYGEWTVVSLLEGKHSRFCSTCKYTEKKKFEFSNVSVTLQNNMTINFKANKALFEDIGYENPYVVFEFNGKQTVVTDYVVDGDKYVFSFNDIAPDKMNDTIKAKLYATYGGTEYSSDEASYSIAAYCYVMLGNTTDAKLRTLLVDLLHYGAATQAYTGYKTDELADKDLTAEQLAWGTQTNPVLTKITDAHFADVPNPEVSWKSVGLSLNEAITLRLTFAADDTANVVIIIKDENDVTLGEIEAFTASGGRFTARFDGLNAGQMKEKLFITAYRNNQPISNTLLYSVESYAYSKKNDADANLAALVKALMKYGNSAYAYVH